MAFRLYIVPAVTDVEGGRDPKYFVSQGLRWSGMYYGFQPVYLVAADLTPAQDAAIVANTDVTPLPFNLDVAVGGGGVQEARNAFEAALIPAQWISGTTTWREIARTIAGMFAFMQRLFFYMGPTVLIDSSAKLNVQWSSIPADVQTKITTAANSLGYDTSFIQANTQLREILQTFATAWGTKPFVMNEFTF